MSFLHERGRRISSRTFILFGADIIAITAAILLSAIARLGLDQGYIYVQEHWRSLVSSGGIFLLVFYISGLYERQVLTHKKGSLAGIIAAVSISTILTVLFFYARFEFSIGRGILSLAALFICLSSWVVRRLYAIAIGYGMFNRNTLIVGDDEEVSRVISLLKQNRDAGFKVFGIVTTERSEAGHFVHGLPVLGSIQSLKEFSRVYEIETIIVATTLHREPAMLRVLRPLRYAGLEILDYAGLHEQMAQEIPLDHIDDEWLMHAAMNSSRIHIRKIKRVMDVMAALTGLILSLPITLVAALLVRIDSPGPVLFCQKRAGLDGVPFTLIKFRTMRADAEAHGAVWARQHDSRVTRIGKILRKSRIDEIPQLFNVLRGAMSLVGPRPERPEFIESLSKAIPFYQERLLVAPGVTGWAQVVFPYAASIESSRKKLQYDLYYIKHMSFFFDLLIMLRTIKTILVGLRHSESFDQVDSVQQQHEDEVIRVLPSKRETDLSQTA